MTGDDWFGPDKLMHFKYSMGLAVVGLWLSTAAGTPEPGNYILGGGFALSLGIAKEFFDHASGHPASWRDLTWDVIGTAAGLAVSWAVSWVVNHVQFLLHLVK